MFSLVSKTPNLSLDVLQNERFKTVDECVRLPFQIYNLPEMEKSWRYRDACPKDYIQCSLNRWHNMCFVQLRYGKAGRLPRKRYSYIA
jgi:hypothetical protein